MHYSHPQVVFQELPNEISFALSISGCPLGCKGCHSTDTWSPTYGEPLTMSVLQQWLAQYRNMITTVLFYGGEWEPDMLNVFLREIRSHGIKTALYTGLEYDDVPASLLSHLDYLKTGRYIHALGGLRAPSTNQRLLDVTTHRDITHLFHQRIPTSTHAI